MKAGRRDVRERYYADEIVHKNSEHLKLDAEPNRTSTQLTQRYYAFIRITVKSIFLLPQKFTFFNIVAYLA